MKRFCLLALVLTFVIVNIQSGMAGVDDCPDNMVSYWTFDNSGDPGNDDFGTNDVVVSGAVWNSSGQVNGAMSFDGVDDVLTKNDGTDLNTSSGTICAWINPQTYGNGKGIRGSIFEAWTDALNDVGYLGQDTDGSIYIGQYSGDYADSMAMAPLDQWTFVCGTWDSTDFYIYLNGTLDNKGGTGVMPSSLHDYRIGRPCNYASPFNGLIDEVAIYDRALNATEIQEHHANGLADKGYCAEYTPGCGNGALDAGEDCDDGNTVNDSTCPGNCQADGGYCGDGYWGTGEECDDGNNVSGDGCSSTCQLEDNDGDGIPNNVDVCKNSNAPSGMISYWGFEETSGTTAYDSYDANPGTNRYGATINQVGQVGKAYSFDGNDDYIRVSGTSLSFTTPFAVEAWVNIDSSRQHTIVSKRNGILPKPTNYYMAVSPSGGSNVPVFQVAVGNTFYTAVGSPSISVGEWHHITGVYDGTSIHVYLDGALEDSVVLPGIPDTNAAHVYIGSQAGKYDSDGRIDEVAIYDRALDATEIQEHYANGLANKGYCEAAVCADGDADRVCDDVDACNNPSAPSGMISYWGFEETSGTEAADSYDANPGTVNGATWTSSGQVGGALGFDGTDDYVDVGDIGASPSEHTVSFWARRDTFSGGFRSVFQLRSGSSHMLWLYPNGVMGYGNVSGAWDSWGVGWTDTTSYHHIVIVSSSPGRAKLYFDGVDRGNRLVLTYTPWNSVKIGASDIVPYFPGEIDEFAVHDRAFSASEVQFLFNRSSLGDDYCSIPSGCGNGVVNAGEDCDDGNNINDSTCPANCQADGGYCGDGYWGTGEYCEDGNTANGDGCSSSCSIETFPINTVNCPDGMISYWNFDNPNQGTDAFDGNDGVVNGASWIAGKIHSALSFDGYDDSVDVGDIGASPSEYTVSFWARREAFRGSWRSVFQLRSGSSHMLWLYPNGNIGYGNATGAWSTWNGVWTDTTSYHHIALSSSSSGQATLFFDGMNEGTLSVSTLTPWNAIKIGASDTSSYFPGQMDEFAIYDRALAATEIQDHYANGLADKGYCGAAVCADDDADGYGVCPDCGTANGCTYDGDDCDDANSSINPGAADDDCNGIDENCDGIADNDYVPVPTTCGVDLCSNEGTLTCTGGQEVDTCEENPPVTVYLDGDNDTYGDPTITQDVCTLPPGYVFDDTDCDDTESSVNPGAYDICDAEQNVINKDCDPSNDDELNCLSFCGDSDGDAYVTDEKWQEWGGVIPSAICPWIEGGGDCNDFEANVNPEAEEVCDSMDNDCDGKIDEGCPAVNKEDALALLESLSSSDSKSQKELDNAIRELKESLGNRHPEGDKRIVWLDTVHIACRHGNKVFDKEKKTLHHLEKITDQSTLSTVNQSIALIVEADRLLAQTAIDEAPDGVDKDRAIEKLNRAETETENQKRIDAYKQAWKYINKHCDKKDKQSCIEEITVQSPAEDTVTRVGDEVGHPNTVFTDIYGDQKAIHTSCSRCIQAGDVLGGWVILDIVDDGVLAEKCAE